MNTFFLERDEWGELCPYLSAMSLCDKHVNNQQKEMAQMMATAVHLAMGEAAPGPDIIYKPTHPNHGTTVWVRNSIENFEWGYAYGVFVCEAYTNRYGKIHACKKFLDNAYKLRRHIDFPESGLTRPYLAMPDECKVDDVVQSYRNWYMMKAHDFFMQWKFSNPPEWWPYQKSTTDPTVIINKV